LGALGGRGARAARGRVLSLLADPRVRLLDLLEPACRVGRAAVVIGMVELDEAGGKRSEARRRWRLQ